MQLFWAVICVFAFAGSGLAQVSRFSFGVKGGFILSDSDSYPRKGLDRYTVGPTIEASLWKHVAIEADALYKRLERAPVWAPYSEPAGAVTQPGWHYAVLYGTNTTSWEFPVLGKYYLEPVPFFAFLVRRSNPSAGRGARPQAWAPRFGSVCLESGLSGPLCAHYGQFFR